MARPTPKPHFRYRILRWILGLLLLPWVIGCLHALVRVARINGAEAQVWVPLLAGALVWGVIFLSLPRPMWLYVLGHELTHVLWAWAFGAQVRGFRASSRGGMVRLSKSNSLIALAPYFFPLYATLWGILFPLIARLLDARDASPWFLLGLGACYAFHLTLTFHVLRIRQPDLEGEGWFFSAVLIAFGNAAIALVGASLLMPRPGLTTALAWAIQDGIGFLLAWTRWISG